MALSLLETAIKTSLRTGRMAVARRTDRAMRDRAARLPAVLNESRDLRRVKVARVMRLPAKPALNVASGLSALTLKVEQPVHQRISLLRMGGRPIPLAIVRAHAATIVIATSLPGQNLRGQLKTSSPGHCRLPNFSERRFHAVRRYHYWFWPRRLRGSYSLCPVRI